VSGDLTAIPALWVVRYPETGRLLIDESEEFIRGWSTTVPGSTVLRLDVPALLRAKEAVDAAVAEGRAALAALDTPADPTS
jgi:hypothetical protein